MKNKLRMLLGATLGLAPLVALAQTTGTGSGCGNITQVTKLQEAICSIGSLLNSVVPVLVALGVVYFVWGVITYVVGSDEEAKKKGRDRIIYGIIGLAVIVAVWGLVNILTNTFGVGNVRNIQYPTVPIN